MKNLLFYRFVLLVPASFIVFQTLSATSGNMAEITLEDVFNIIFQSEDYSQENADEMYDYLSGLYENPININEADKAELSLLPFLNSRQVEDIQEYLYIHGGMMSLGELQLIESIDFVTRSMLSLFVYAGGRPDFNRKETFRDIISHSHNEIVFRADVPLYLRDGFKYHSEEELLKYPNRQYMGNILQHNIKYTLNMNNRIKLGLSGDKDSGELFTGGKTPVYDFFSGYIQIENFGFVNNLIAGNIKATFGRGLILNNGFGMGKEFFAGSMDKIYTPLRPHSSISEYNYLTGVGGTFSFGKIHISTILSYTAIDATLKADSAISSFKTDGYHRTILELSKKGNSRETLMALHSEWRYNGIDLGLTSVVCRFDKTLLWDSGIYSDPTSSDKWYWNAGIDYSITRAYFSISGETAICDNKSFATVNSIDYRLSGNCKLRLLYRDYSPKYHTFHGSSISESEICNERGIYAGADCQLSGIEASLYADLFHFPGPRSSASRSSDGYDAQLRLIYTPENRSNSLSVRYRIKRKESDSKISGTLESEYTGRLRVQWNHLFSPECSLREQADFVHFFNPDTGFESGIAFGSTLSLERKNRILSGSVSVCGVVTDSYDTSISIYEKGLLYSYNFITLYGRCLRESLVIKCNLSKSFYIAVKFGGTQYFDRKEIGTSTQKISSSHKEDISVQLRAKF